MIGDVPLCGGTLQHRLHHLSPNRPWFELPGEFARIDARYDAGYGAGLLRQFRGPQWA